VQIEVKDGEREIADGGFVDWTQKLLGNNKERLLISALGLRCSINFNPDLCNSPTFAA
jgi:hypothetical protein